MLKRRHSSLMLAPSCSANLTNSSRLDMIDTSFQGMAVLQSSNGLIAYRCKPCPWTGVNDVPGLYRQERYTRSLKLPRWLSVMVMHFDAHEVHHMYPNVPGYRLHRIAYTAQNEVDWL